MKNFIIGLFIGSWLGPIIKEVTRRLLVQQHANLEKKADAAKHQRDSYKDSLLFDSMEAPRSVRTELRRIANEQGFATVADLHNATGGLGRFIDTKIGWDQKTLTGADIQSTEDGWRLDLPEPRFQK